MAMTNTADDADRNPPVAMVRGGSTPILDALKVVALVVETSGVAYVLAGNGWMALLVTHVAVVGLLLLTLILVELSGLDSGSLQKFVLLTFAGGPIGSTAALLGELPLWRPESAVLENWYETIAPTEKAAVTLVDQIIDRRLIRKESQLPRRYENLLINGSMQEKQALLAYLAVEEDQTVAIDALSLALRSPDQRVRVQAAAVAAHTRARARRLLAEKKRLLSLVASNDDEPLATAALTAQRPDQTELRS